ncbi:MAG: glutathione S-transferase N-terminal domain-containing protein [Pseudomonadota bacterium]
MIDLHYVRTMNGHKVALMLEEAGLPYNVIEYDIFAGDHLTPRFRAINPNCKLPAIVDHEPADGGEPLAVFESGAILMYLAEKSGKFLPAHFRRREMARQWLVWQVAGLGPMHGQANHFMRYAPDGQEYGIERYAKEARRLLDVLETRLSKVEYLAEEYSIADMACWPAVRVAHTIDLGLEQFPSLKRWATAIGERPAAQRVINGDQTKTPDGLISRRMTLSAEQWSNMFGERMHNAPAHAA